jgi:hypothetical protein
MNETELTRKVKKAAAEHDVDVQSAKVFGNTLFVEADTHVSELSYLAALWFHELSENEFEEVAIRHNETGDIEEYGLYEVLGKLVAAADESFSFSEK